jgi:hypothetical protein
MDREEALGLLNAKLDDYRQFLPCNAQRTW